MSMLTPSERLERQMSFIAVIDKLKAIQRQTLLADGSRNENSAEHSWHIAVMALVLAEYAGDAEIDLGRVIAMLLVHDIVEIEAGDTYCYDSQQRADQAEREQTAARRLFSLLPGDQALELRALWQEFEQHRTPEAAFAHALDRLQPLLNNYQTQGRKWREKNVRREQVIKRMAPIRRGAPALWRKVQALIDDAVQNGWLAPARTHENLSTLPPAGSGD